MRYEFKALAEIAWAFAVTFGVYAFTELRTVDDLWDAEAWWRPLIAGAIRAGLGGALAVLTRLRAT